MTSTFAQSIVKKLYSLTVDCSKLVGYDDINFKCFDPESGTVYLLKLTPYTEKTVLDFQVNLLEYISDKGVHSPKIIKSLSQNAIEVIEHNGGKFFARLLTWVHGEIFDNHNILTIDICRKLGFLIADSTLSTRSFDYVPSTYSSWNSDHVLDLEPSLNMLTEGEKELILPFFDSYKKQYPSIKKLKKSVIHSDLNPANILFSKEKYDFEFTGIIDYGDACYSTEINNLAIALFYLLDKEEDILGVVKHIIQAYHKVIPILESEIENLYYLIGARAVVSLTHAAISRDNGVASEYNQASVESGFTSLKRLISVGPFLFKAACYGALEMEMPEYKAFKTFIQNHHIHLSQLVNKPQRNKVFNIDLSLTSPHVPHPENPHYESIFDMNLKLLRKDNEDKFIIGGYGEVRNFYITDAYLQSTFHAPVHRTKHLGIDIWEEAGTEILAPFDGEVYMIEKHDAHKDYGVLLILKHTIDDLSFYTLYGHLSERTFQDLKKGQKVSKGESIATLGDYQENGHWTPHLHFQIILNLLGKGDNFDGVARPDYWSFFHQICPDPALIFKEKILGERSDTHQNKTNIARIRGEVLGRGLSLSYENPLHIVRGKGAFLLDSEGQAYLDTVNNVAHVGHENYHVVASAQNQLAILNTNTRYLHENVVAYAKKLLSYFPKELSVVHFVNSGSEANELALRMAKTATGHQKMIAMKTGYHGNTGGTIDVSSYKFDAKGGHGKPKDTFLLDIPDYILVDNDSSVENYIRSSIENIENWIEKGHHFAGFIHESILSCAGQVPLPKDFLKLVYSKLREYDVICIADEVQTGFGRVGEKFWAFELYDVIPDIVVLGKPIGNGHPLGAVICTAEIADKFNNGMEYFNTYGGNPVSAATGQAVLNEISTYNLQSNAFEMGEYLKAELRKIQDVYPIIADVRGFGLFLGVEFVDKEGEPASRFVSLFTEHMLEMKVLCSIDGPRHNVIKIKPPIIFNKQNANQFLYAFRRTMNILTV